MLLHEIAMSRGERSACHFLSCSPNLKLTVHYATLFHAKAFISLYRYSLSISTIEECSICIAVNMYRLVLFDKFIDLSVFWAV